MKGVVRALTAAALTAWVGGEASADEPAVAVERFQLDNGLRVVVVHVPDATRQCTFTFLPLHLANDGPGRAQWSHLVEHHVIRSTDPAALAAGGIEVNAETTADALRLDTCATPEAWEESIGRHAKWLAEPEMLMDVHARELGNIKVEERTVIANGYGHKFAVAGWNQVLRHGATAARVHGDTADAAVETVQRYARTTLGVDDRVMVATIGPAAPEAVRATVEKRLGVQRRDACAIPPATRDGDWPESIEATWDLPARYVVVWWRLSGDNAASQAAAMMVGRLTGAALHRDAPPGAAGPVIVMPNVPAPEGRYLLVAAPLKRDADATELREFVDRVLLEAPSSPHAWPVRTLLSREWQPPDFAAWRAQAPDGLKGLVEGQWLLNMAITEFVTGVQVDALAEALDRADAAALREFVTRLSHAPRGVVVLNPAPAP